MEKKYFGALLACSRGVTNVATVKRLMDKLSLMGYNLLELQIDTEYKIKGEPFFGYLNGAYTKEEIQEMDRYAQSKGIELVPCIQTLGHLGRLLCIPAYAHLSDTPDALLVDEPKTYELIDKMFQSISDSFSSRLINIGVDETFNLGLGRYLCIHGYTDRYEILLRHVGKVVDLAKKYGFKPRMWSDMFEHLATEKDKNGVAIIDEKVIAQVPEDIELCHWWYEKRSDEVWDAEFKMHNKFNRKIWFYGGSWTWWGYAPFNRYSIDAMKNGIIQAQKNGVENIVITMWADSGHECSFFSALPALYTMRQYYLGNTDESLIKQGFKETFAVEYDDFMLLDLPNKNPLNENFEKLDCTSRNVLFNDAFLGKMDSMIEKVLPIPFGEYRDILLSVAPRMGEYAYLFINLANLCNVCELKVDLGIKTRKAYQSENKEELKRLVPVYYETAKRLESFKDSFKEYWLKDNKTSHTLLYHEVMLGGLIARLKDCGERIEKYLDGRILEISELTETILDNYGRWNSIWGWEF